MDAARVIRWEGFYNTRDLGGLPVRGGGTTRHGAFLRSADLRFVTDAGWRAARAAGVRTIVDLRNEDEIRKAQFAAENSVTPEGFGMLEVPIDDIEDLEFWLYISNQRLGGTPLYYGPFLDRKPERCAAAIIALARTGPGGVLYHCAAGRDRTGLISLLLLALADDELIIGHRHSEWTGWAPHIEEDLAFSSIAQDEMAHARLLYELAGGLVGRDVDSLALGRPANEYRSAVLCERPNRDWGFTIARQYLYDTADAVRIEALADSSWRELAGRS